MDPNGAKLHLLLTREDWLTVGTPAPAVSLDRNDRPELEWLEARAGLSPARRGTLFRGARAGAPLTPGLRRGADRGDDGTWYVVSADGSSVEAWLRDGTIRTVWPLPTGQGDAGLFTPKTPARPAPPAALSGLAVTDDHYLVVGSREPPALLVLDLYGGGEPVRVDFPDDFEPVDLEAVAGGGLVLLDRARGRPRHWCLDRSFTVASPGALPAPATPFDPGDPGDPGGHPPMVTAPPVDERGSHPIDVADPTAIVALPDGTVLVLDREPGAPASTVHRFRGSDPVGEPTSLEGVLAGFLGDPDADADVVGHDLAFVPGPEGGGTVVVSDAGGDQSFAFTLTETGLEIEPTYYPMRLHAGRGLVAAGGQVHFDTADRWHRLVPHGHQRYTEGGSYTSTPLDSAEPGCVWHRLLLDGCIPAGAAVRVETRCADAAEDLSRVPWRAEPAPYRRAWGSELPDFRPAGSEGAAEGTFETLLQSARGRFLQLRLTLRRHDAAPPVVRALRLTYPRFSYREEYLPAVYGEQARSADLLDRYLANPEGLLTALEARIADVQTLLDHRTTPEDYLDWLAGWVGAALHADWEPHRKRVFLERANDLFRTRGTIRGLVAAVRLAVDADPGCAFDEVTGPFGVRVVEEYGVRQLGNAPLGDPTRPADVVLVDPGGRWSPDQGVRVLQARFSAHVLARRPGAGGPDLVLAPTTPATEPARADWTTFVAAELGVVEPSLSEPDLPVVRRYLAQTYGSFADYAAAYGSSARGTSFDEVGLPTTMPVTGPPLHDWTALVTRVLPIARRAHRFTVLVPVPLEATEEEQRDLVAAARDVVARERPAHTGFEVRPFWAALRVGSARVGLETQVGRGSRFVPLGVGTGELGRAYLSAPDRDVRRRVVGSTTPSNRRGSRP